MYTYSVCYASLSRIPSLLFSRNRQLMKANRGFLIKDERTICERCKKFKSHTHTPFSYY